NAIAQKYQSEGLVGLLGIVEAVFASSAADRKQEVIGRIEDAYAGAIPDALRTALEAAPAREAGAQGGHLAGYERRIKVPGIETDTGFVALINNGGGNVERFNYRNMEGLVINTMQGDDYVVADDVIAPTTINLGSGDDRVQIGQVFRSERTKDPEGE